MFFLSKKTPREAGCGDDEKMLDSINNATACNSKQNLISGCF